MPKDAEYESLLNKYNMAIAWLKDLEEQKQTKERQFAEYEARHDVIEKNARKLCEQILAKDRSQMVLGTNEGWHSLDIGTMIVKAQAGFVKYCQERTEVLNRLCKVAEDRRRDLENLQDQIESMMVHGNIANPESFAEAAEKAAKEQSAIQKSSYATQQAIKNNQVVAVVEDEDDVEEKEIEALSAMAEVAETFKHAPNTPVIGRAQGKIDKLKKAEQERRMTRVTNMADEIKRLSGLQKDILRYIGETGQSRNPLIQQYFIDNMGIKKNAFNTAMTGLQTSSMVEITKEVFTLTTNINIVQLTEKGIDVFKYLFSKNPVESEVKAICGKHASINHGYGILTLSEWLEKSGEYESITIDTKNNNIEVTVGSEKKIYQPDIVCHAANYDDYYEFELGNHNQDDFNQKCEKMKRVTPRLQFIVPNTDVAKVIKKQVDNWLETYKKEGRTPGKFYILIGTPKAVTKPKAKTKDKVINNNDWLVVYNTRKSMEAIQYSLR